MQIRSLILFLLLSCFGCKNTEDKPEEEQKFDKMKWATKKDQDYPHRDKMLKDLMTNYKLHGIKKDSVVHLLGQPNRSDSGHLFYTIAQERFGVFPVHTKTLVIKLTKDSTVEWRKIHE
jgi:hypothetical protein